jgi:hypothetical protein
MRAAIVRNRATSRDGYRDPGPPWSPAFRPPYPRGPCTREPCPSPAVGQPAAHIEAPTATQQRPRVLVGPLRFWSRWADVLVVVKPDTVLRWHRAGFRLFWRWKSRSLEASNGPAPLGAYPVRRTRPPRGLARRAASILASFTPWRAAASVLTTEIGSWSMSVSRARAGPSGRRRFCSHPCSVPIATPNARAKSPCDSFVFSRTVATSTSGNSWIVRPLRTGMPTVRFLHVRRDPEPHAGRRLSRPNA